MYNIKKYFFEGLIFIISIFLTLIIIFKTVGYLSSVIFNYFPINKLVELNLKNHTKNLFLLQFSNIIGYLISICFIGIFTTIIGYVTYNFISKDRIKKLENNLLVLPFSKTIYSTVKQISQIFLSEELSAFRKVVLVEYPKKDIYSIGFLTNSKIDINLEDNVAVFIPTAPNPTTGMLIIANRSSVLELDMKIEEAIKIVISAGAIYPEKKSF